jgi:hypothetical protein
MKATLLQTLRALSPNGETLRRDGFFASMPLILHKGREADAFFPTRI